MRGLAFLLQAHPTLIKSCCDLSNRLIIADKILFFQLHFTEILVDLVVVVYSINKKITIGFCMDIQRYLRLFKKCLLWNEKHYSCCVVAVIFILAGVTGKYSYAAAPFSLDIGREFARIFKPNYFNAHTFQDKCSGKMYSASAGTFRYPYIAFNNSIPARAIPVLEQHFMSMGYNPIGKNTRFKVDGKLIASCDVDVNRLSQYSSSNIDFYECTAQCNLKDHENNFIVYGGQGTAYGSDRENIRSKAVLLAFRNLGRNSQTQSYSVSIDGFDNGVRTNRQTDYAEAVLDAKKQAIERAGVRMNIGRKTGRTYRQRNGKDSLDKYSTNNIESYASGVLAPGYQIEDHGYGRDGSYHITLRGNILQDPATALRNHTEGFRTKEFSRSSRRNVAANLPDPSDLLRNNGVQNVFEYKRSNMLFNINYPSGKITFQIIRTFQPRPGVHCRTARAAFSWTSMARNFTACRNPHTGRWNLNQQF